MAGLGGVQSVWLQGRAAGFERARHANEAALCGVQSIAEPVDRSLWSERVDRRAVGPNHRPMREAPLMLWRVGLGVAVGVGLALAPAATAQDQPLGDPPAQAATAAELLAALQAMGVALPEGIAVGEDGSVSLPSQPGQQGTGAMVPVGGAEAAPVPPTPQPTPGPTPDPEPEPEPKPEPKPEWKQRIEASFSLNEGNTESSDFRGMYRATRKREIDKLVFKAAYYRQTDNGETSEDRFMAEGNYDRDIPDTRWLWFVNGRYEWDKFESWDHRVGLSAGLGYRAIDRENMELILRAGGGFTREFGSDRDEFIPEGLFGYDFEWELNDRQGLESTFRYYPDLSELGEFRTVTTLGWKYALDVKKGLDLNAGLLHEYQSDVDPGIDESDLRLYAGVGFDF